MGIYTGYFDESSHEEKTYLIIGGLVLDTENADAFDKDWVEAIKDLPKKEGFPQLHMKDFISGNAEYYPEWKARYDEKRKILQNAGRVICSHALQVFTTVLNVDDMMKLDKQYKVTEALGHPYALAMRIASVQLRQWADANHIQAKMLIEQRSGYGELAELFIKDRLDVPQPGKKNICALQAADYIAWMRLKKLEPTSSYDRIKDSWKEINRTLYVDDHFDRVRLESVCQKLAEISGRSLPLRDDDNDIILYGSNMDKPRRQFLRAADRPKRKLPS